MAQLTVPSSSSPNKLFITSSDTLKMLSANMWALSCGMPKHLYHPPSIMYIVIPRKGLNFSSSPPTGSSTSEPVKCRLLQQLFPTVPGSLFPHAMPPKAGLSALHMTEMSQSAHISNTHVQYQACRKRTPSSIPQTPKQSTALLHTLFPLPLPNIPTHLLAKFFDTTSFLLDTVFKILLMVLVCQHIWPVQAFSRIHAMHQQHVSILYIWQTLHLFVLQQLDHIRRFHGNWLIFCRGRQGSQGQTHNGVEMFSCSLDRFIPDIRSQHPRTHCSHLSVQTNNLAQVRIFWNNLRVAPMTQANFQANRTRVGKQLLGTYLQNKAICLFLCVPISGALSKQLFTCSRILPKWVSMICNELSKD